MDKLEAKVAQVLLTEGYTLSTKDENGWSIVVGSKDTPITLKMRFETLSTGKQTLYILRRNAVRVCRRTRSLGNWGWLDRYTKVYHFRSARKVVQFIEETIRMQDEFRVHDAVEKEKEQKKQNEEARIVGVMKNLGLSDLSDSLKACAANPWTTPIVPVRDPVLTATNGFPTFKNDRFRVHFNFDLEASAEGVRRLGETVRDLVSEIQKKNETVPA